MALRDPLEATSPLLPDIFRRWFVSRGWTPRAHQLGLLAKAEQGRSVLLIAPTVHHRLRFRERVKDQLVRTANRLVLVGSTALGLAIGSATYVIGDSAFPDTHARALGPGLTALAALVWFVVPMRYRPSDGADG